jgi:hypothetical protein
MARAGEAGMLSLMRTRSVRRTRGFVQVAHRLVIRITWLNYRQTVFVRKRQSLTLDSAARCAE